MYYITREIKYNKKLKKILKKNINFSPLRISNKHKGWKNEINYSLLGNAYELLFQINQIKKEKRISDFHSLKYSRGKEILLKYKDQETSFNILKKIYLYEKIIMRYISNNKTKGIDKAILYLTEVSNIRRDEDILKIKLKKEDIKELTYMRKKFNKKIFKKIKNSTFSYIVESGLLIGEIDIIEKNRIVDIKTTYDPIITRDMINQQILYVLLLEIGHGVKTKEIGIYFQKYNKLKIIKVKKLLKNKKRIISYLKVKYNS